MKVKVKSDEFSKKVQVTAQAAVGKLGGEGSDIYTCLKIVAKDKQIELTGTGMDVCIQKKFDAEVEKEGAVAVPAKILSEAVGLCDNEFTTLEIVSKKLRVKSGSFKIDLSLMPVENYPEVVIENIEKCVSIPADALKSMIQAVTTSAATDEARPAFAGALIQTESGEKECKLVLAATDGFRLAEAKWPTEINKGMTAIKTILPRKGLEKLVRSLEGEEAVAVGMSLNGRIQFRHTGTVVTVNGINGSFPDYLPLIPKEAATIVSFATASLLRGLKAGRLIGEQGTFSMKPKEGGKGNVILEVEGDKGEVEKNIEAMLRGEAQEICVNLQYLRDAIEGCERLGYDGVYMSTLGYGKALLVKPPEDKEKKKPSAQFIVMPSMGKKKQVEPAKAEPAKEATMVTAAAPA